MKAGGLPCSTVQYSAVQCSTMCYCVLQPLSSAKL